jgi:periplasmic divalent cation tolerance protein
MAVNLERKPARATIGPVSVNPEFPACATPAPAEPFPMFVAWTTVENRVDADRLAASAVAANLAVCVQIEGPIASHYRWQGKDERSEEFRLTFKCLPARLDALQQQVLAAHPYDTPEWIVVRAERVGEKYLSWANTNSSTPPL